MFIYLFSALLFGVIIGGALVGRKHDKNFYLIKKSKDQEINLQIKKEVSRLQKATFDFEFKKENNEKDIF